MDNLMIKVLGSSKDSKKNVRGYRNKWSNKLRLWLLIYFVAAPKPFIGFEQNLAYINITPRTKLS